MTTAHDIVETLLQRHERNPGRTRAAGIHPDYAGLRSAAAVVNLHQALRSAERMGAVGLDWMRGREIIERVMLTDPAAAARFLGRPLAGDDVERAFRFLADLLATAPEWVRLLGDEARHRLSRRSAAWGLDADAALLQERFTLLRAIAEGKGEGMAPRTFCRRIGLDSKAYEKHAAGLAAMIRHALGLDEAGIEAVLGFQSYLPPILIRGPVRVSAPDGIEMDGLVSPYLPIAAEWGEHIRPLPAARGVLTIENLTSFHRQVRECPEDDLIVLYLGGFPNRSVRSALARLSASGLPVHHWGDVDAGGVRIARHLRAIVDRQIRLHRMSPDLARRHGRRFGSSPSISPDPLDGTDMAELVSFLRSGEARWLEQESLPPAPVGC